MAVTMTALAFAVGSAVVSGVNANRQVKYKNMQAMEAAARRDASIDVSVGMQQESMTGSAAEYMRVLQENQRKIDSAAQVTQAAHTVEAAASGTSGQSVEITRQAIDHNAGTMQGDLTRSHDRAMHRLDNKFREIGIQGEAQKQEIILDNERTGQGVATLIRNLGMLQGGFSVGGGDTGGGVTGITDSGGGFIWDGDLGGFF